MRSLFLFAVLLASICASPQTRHPNSKAVATAPDTSETQAKPIAVHDFEVDGVKVALMEVKRTGPDVVTVRWEYRNTTDQPQKLATVSKGWSDPYRLSLDSYLADEATRTKSPLSRDTDNRPVAAAIGSPVHPIEVMPGKTIKSWAKYVVDPSTRTVTVVFKGVEPFEGVTIDESPR